MAHYSDSDNTVKNYLQESRRTTPRGPLKPHPRASSIPGASCSFSIPTIHASLNRLRFMSMFPLRRYCCAVRSTNLAGRVFSRPGQSVNHCCSNRNYLQRASKEYNPGSVDDPDSWSTHGSALKWFPHVTGVLRWSNVGQTLVKRR
jgi:hypothetical protein